MQDVHTIQLDLSWKLISQLNTIEHFRGSWVTISKHEETSLKHLKDIATVRSVGASTRIEGSKLSDDEVNHLLKSLHITALTERDAQEVAGYYEVLELIVSSHQDIPVTENAITDLHNRLMKYSQKDEWHRGKYKQHANHLEASLPDGSKQIIFQTTPPGHLTDDGMRLLIAWYNSEIQVHPLIKCAVFVYDFLSIHPFQDGNGRLSRLLATLLLLKNNYTWIQYISFEHEIENRKAEYYAVLRECQSQRPHEDVTAWINFFIDCLTHLQQLLMKKLQSSSMDIQISPRERSILLLIRERPGIQSGELAQRLGIPNPTVKRILRELVLKQLIEKKGIGRSTWYGPK